MSAEVNRDEHLRLGMPPDGFRKNIRGNQGRAVSNIKKDRVCAQIPHHFRRSREGHGRHQNLVSGTDAQGFEGKMQRRRAGINRAGKAGADDFGKTLFKRVGLSGSGQPAAGEHFANVVELVAVTQYFGKRDVGHGRDFVVLVVTAGHRGLYEIPLNPSPRQSSGRGPGLQKNWIPARSMLE